MSRDILGMPLAAEVSTELAEGRGAWLALAVDTWRITKPGVGEPVLDEATGVRVPPAPVLVYEGPARLQIRSDVNSNVVEVTAGEREWAYQTATLAVPIATPPGALGDPTGVHIDQTATCLVAVEDPALQDRVFQIRAIMHKTHATSRRLRVTETVG